MLGRPAINLSAHDAALAAGLRRAAEELATFRRREELRKAARKRPAWVLSIVATRGPRARLAQG